MSAALQSLRGDENFLLLQQDIVDRQIVDVHGRKVVRANDVNLQWFSHDAVQSLRVTGVEVGLSGAMRRIFKGVLSRTSLESFSNQVRYPGYSVGTRRRDRGRSGTAGEAED